MMITISASTRLVNSISVWKWKAGVGRPLQSGQSGQPSPEFVTRTSAPETMFTYSAISATTAIGRNAPGPVRRDRNERTPAVSPRSLECAGNPAR